MKGMRAPPPSPEPGTVLRAVGRAGAALNRLLLRAVERATPSEQNRLLGLTIAVGAACGLAAVGFHLFIRLVEATFFARVAGASGVERALGLLVVPTLGALVAGLALDRLVPEARGSGIPQVKWVYAARSGRLRNRDGAAKFVLAALQIGTGSSLGREGPTVQICATVASALGRLFALSPSNQRRLIPVGAAAGIAAAFNAPIAAVTFVIEELVGGLDTTVLSGVVVAAAISAAVEHSILGERPVLAVPVSYGLTHASSLLVFATLGLMAGLLGHAFSTGLLRARAGFRGLTRVPPWARPALGGLLTGLIALCALELVGTLGVAGGGYETLERGLRGDLPLKVLAVLCVAKFAATIASYSSGGAGGIFAPTLFVGAMLGGLMGEVDRHVLRHADAQLGAFALVGMGAFFAAVVRAPMTSILIVFEMTGSYKLVLPLMVANAAAYVTARAWNPTPIYDALLHQDGRHGRRCADRPGRPALRGGAGGVARARPRGRGDRGALAAPAGRGQGGRADRGARPTARLAGPRAEPARRARHDEPSRSAADDGGRRPAAAAARGRPGDERRGARAAALRGGQRRPRLADG